MLRLVTQTDPAWVHRMETHLPELLLDHAHCEKKAASTAMSLIFRYPHFTEMLRPLSEIAREELEHFEMMLVLLQSRGEQFRKLSPSPYAGKLLSRLRTDETERLIDTLLCCALIEARSCERMTLLSRHLESETLRQFYGKLLESEARHFSVYVNLALRLAPKQKVSSRLDELANWEAEVISCAPSVPRMHN